MESCEVTKFSNGLTIISEYIPYVESFSLGFWFNIGSRDENAENNGIAHFIEHLLFKGTTKRTSKQIAELIESYGGYLNAFTSKEHTCFYARGLKNNFRLTFDVLADLVQNPAFKQKDVELESGVILDELLDINDNPEEIIFDKIEEFLFEGNNLSLPIIGTQNNIESFDREMLLKYHSEKYGFDNCIITCSGNVDHEAIVKLAEEFFKGEKKSSLQEREVPGTVKSTDLVINKDIEQDYCIIGTAGVGQHHPDRTKYIILLNILGEGSSSRLYQELREKRGIAYQINSFLNNYGDTSSIGVFFSTAGKNVSKATDAIFREFEKLKEKNISEKELNKGKEYLKGSTIISLESTTNRMMRLANSFLYYGRIIPISEQLAPIDEVTAEDLRVIANNIFAPEKLSKIIIKANRAGS